jgi:hypothetical protein
MTFFVEHLACNGTRGLGSGGIGLANDKPFASIFVGGGSCSRLNSCLLVYFVLVADSMTLNIFQIIIKA